MAASAKDIEETKYGEEKLQNLFLRIANSGEIVKSQQRNDPELTSEEKIDILQEICSKNPASFLMRFGKFLLPENLDYFQNLHDTDTAAHFEISFRLKEIRKLLDSKTKHVGVQNRRYAALQRLSKDSSFFSEEEMRKRNPLLYEQYIGQYLTDEEKLQRDLAEQGRDPSLSQMLFSRYDAEKTEWIYNYQKEREDDMEEEEEEEDSESEDDMDMQDQDKPGSPIKGTPTEAEKQVLREEFLTEMQENFLLGKEDEFDYSTVDMNDEYDDLKLRERDEEEKYFDDDDENANDDG